MTWEDITLKQYLEIHKINKSEFDDIDKYVRLISILNNIPIQQVRDMPIKELNKYIDNLKLGELKPLDRVPKKVFIDGVEYDVINKFSDLTFGQFVDLQVALAKEGELEDKMDGIIKVFLFKDGKYAHDVDVSNMRFIDAYSIFVFFYHFRERLYRIMRLYLAIKTMEIRIRMYILKMRMRIYKIKPQNYQ